MTVDAYLRAEVPGYPFESNVIEKACLSPVFAKPTPLHPISKTDVIEDFVDDDEFIKSLKYATSTLYYSAAGVFSGGSRSEKRGNRQMSVSGFIITQSDREYYRRIGDKLRGELDCEIEEGVSDEGRMFDAGYLRNRN